jgi:hypothetical protein
MTGFNNNNKFIPKLPETKTQIILNQEQSQPQAEQSTVKKLTETAKETVIPTVHASDDDEVAKGITKGVGGAVLAAGSLIPSPVQPIAATMAGAASATGTAMKVAGQASDNEGMREGGEVVRDMGAVGGVPNLIKVE